MSEPISKGARAGSGAPPGRIRRFVADARGATALEYAMIAGLIFAVAAGSIRLYGSKVDGVYGRIGTAVSQIN